MIEDLKKFKLDLDHFAKTVMPQEYQKYFKRVAIKVHQGVVAGSPGVPNGTPVDTGWARANWGVHIGQNGVPVQPFGERPEEGAPPMPATQYINGTEVIQTTKLSSIPFIWIYNNVPYIELLEDGHSGQAPTGMVIHALHNLQTFVDNI